MFAAVTLPPNERLKLAGGDRFKGISTVTTY